MRNAKYHVFILVLPLVDTNFMAVPNANKFIMNQKSENMFEKVFPKLPFRVGSDAWKKRLSESRIKGETPKEVNCFGVEKYEILEKLPKRVRIFNEKAEVWEEHDLVEYVDICPICGTLMLVRAIKGTTWLALCSKECYEEFNQLKKNLKVSDV